MTKYEHAAGFVPVTPDHRDREGISLIDVWEALARRKSVFLSVVAVSAVIGAALALRLPVQEQVSTVIEIGRRIVDNRIAPIDTPQTTMVKINEGYIPMARNAYAKDHPGEQIPLIKAGIPRNSDVIVLESRAHPADKTVQVQQHLLVVKLLQEDHDRVLSVIRNGLNQHLQQGENALAALRGDRAFLLAGIRRIDERLALIRGEIKEGERLVQAAERNWDRATSESSSASTAMVQLLITNELQQNRAKLTAMKETLLITLPEERDRLQKAVEDNQRAQEEQKAAIENTRMQLANVQETRALGGQPMSNAVPAQRSLVLLLALVIGIIVGAIAAVVVDSISRARYTTDARRALA